MERKKLERINELSKLKRERELTPEEAKEQKELRMEYIAGFRASLTGTLENTVIKHPDGRIERVADRKKSDDKK